MKEKELSIRKREKDQGQDLLYEDRVSLTCTHTSFPGQTGGPCLLAQILAPGSVFYLHAVSGDLAD